MTYSNMSLDELLNEINYDNRDLYLELQWRIDQAIQKAADDAIETEDKEEQEYNKINSIESMEYFCSQDLIWIKDETKTSIRYHVKGFDESTHYENHNISIYCDKKDRTSWKVQINCGILGEQACTFNVNGNFKEAQTLALDKAKAALKAGYHFIIT